MNLAITQVNWRIDNNTESRIVESIINNMTNRLIGMRISKFIKYPKLQAELLTKIVL